MTDATTLDPPPPDDDANPAREGVQLNADGTTALWVDGIEYRLRRPKGREFRLLRESLQSLLDEINDAVADANVRKASIREMAMARPERDYGDPSEPVYTAQERGESRQASKDVTKLREERTAGWWCQVIATLGRDGRRLEVEDVPPWLLDEDETIVLLAHWRSVPSLSGGR